MSIKARQRRITKSDVRAGIPNMLLTTTFLKNNDLSHCCGGLHLFLVHLQHGQHNLVNENVDLLVSADQVNANLLAHRL